MHVRGAWKPSRLLDAWLILSCPCVWLSCPSVYLFQFSSRSGNSCQVWWVLHWKSFSWSMCDCCSWYCTFAVYWKFAPHFGWVGMLGLCLCLGMVDKFNNLLFLSIFPSTGSTSVFISKLHPWRFPVPKSVNLLSVFHVCLWQSPEEIVSLIDFRYLWVFVAKYPTVCTYCSTCD